MSGVHSAHTWRRIRVHLSGQTQILKRGPPGGNQRCSRHTEWRCTSRWSAPPATSDHPQRADLAEPTRQLASSSDACGSIHSSLSWASWVRQHQETQSSLRQGSRGAQHEGRAAPLFNPSRRHLHNRTIAGWGRAPRAPTRACPRSPGTRRGAPGTARRPRCASRRPAAPARRPRPPSPSAAAGSCPAPHARRVATRSGRVSTPRPYSLSLPARRPILALRRALADSERRVGAPACGQG